MKKLPKTLFLVRHAKSSWNDPSLDDIERPLNRRGQKNAPEMGRRLCAEGLRPDHIMSSPARRARATATHIAVALGMQPEAIEIDQELYFAGIPGMLRALRRVGDQHDSVMMVGHNPTMTDLLNQVARTDLWNMPTSAIAVVGFDMVSWGLVDSTEGVLLGYDKPKGRGQFVPPEL